MMFWRMAASIFSSVSLRFLPSLRHLSRVMISITPAACSPPITEVRELGQAKMKSGPKPRPHMP